MLVDGGARRGCSARRGRCRCRREQRLVVLPQRAIACVSATLQRTRRDRVPAPSSELFLCDPPLSALTSVRRRFRRMHARGTTHLPRTAHPTHSPGGIDATRNPSWSAASPKRGKLRTMRPFSLLRTLRALASPGRSPSFTLPAGPSSAPRSLASFSLLARRRGGLPRPRSW